MVANLEGNCENHADLMCRFAAAMLACIERVRILGRPLQMRIGIHSGSAAGGVVGHSVPKCAIAARSDGPAQSDLEATGHNSSIQALLRFKHCFKHCFDSSIASGRVREAHEARMRLVCASVCTCVPQFRMRRAAMA